MPHHTALPPQTSIPADPSASLSCAAPTGKPSLSLSQHNMLQKQIREQFMLSADILSAMSIIPREQFVPLAYRELAYAELQIPLADHEVMLTPNQEARILQALSLTNTMSVLEIGTGSGYFTALLAHLTSRVHSIEVSDVLHRQAKNNLQALAISNVDLTHGDGCAAEAMQHNYDRICVTGGLYQLPAFMLQHLKPQGQLFALLGERPTLQACLFQQVNGQWQKDVLFEADVPMLLNGPSKNPFNF